MDVNEIVKKEQEILQLIICLERVVDILRNELKTLKIEIFEVYE